jgi:AAA family ATP:ADP antiporter
VGWLSKIKEIHQLFLGLEEGVKGKIFRLGGVLFLLFFSYPMIRVTTTSFLLDSFGAKGSPYAWCYSVVFLIFSVGIFNKAQKTTPIHKIYLATVAITITLFILFFVFFKVVSPYGAYFLYVGKEVYIVLLVNSVLAYLNTVIDKSTAKIVYGPLGAFSSIGGILGAFFTSLLAANIDIGWIYCLGLFFISATVFIFSTSFQGKSIHEDEERTQAENKVSPLQAIRSVRTYILLIATIVLLSQFVINIANYQFNFFLSDYFSNNAQRSEFLGRVYGFINLFSLLIQLFAIPLVLKYVPSFLTHLGVVGSYSLAFLVPLVIGAPSLLSAAGTFIIFKGLDYSIFSAAKELLYFSLNDQQKYGAKYIVDMVFYRFSKGLISVILILVPIGAVNWLMVTSLITWMVLLVPLFRIYRNMKTELES